MSNEELRGCQAPGSALEKIRLRLNRFFICSIEYFVRSNDKSFYCVTVSQVRRYSRCNPSGEIVFYRAASAVNLKPSHSKALKNGFTADGVKKCPSAVA